MLKSTLKPIVFAVVLVAMGGAAYGQTPDFRNVNWGMSRLEVMAGEDRAPVSFKAPYIYYMSRIRGQEHHLVYGFIEDKLVNAVYIIITRDPNEYRRFTKTLEMKYGRPKTSVDQGMTNYLFTWESKRTEIIVKPGNIRECRIEYVGKKYKSLRAKKENERKKSASDELLWAY